jgi:chromosome segregation ATPase
MTTPIEVHRDSFGKELTPPQHAEREEKIAKHMESGRDRYSAENLADGRPEWSQRLVDHGRDHTKSAAYQANQRSNAEAVKGHRPHPDPDLEHQFDNIQFQISNWQEVLDSAGANIDHLEKRRDLARELLADSEGFTDAMAASDTQRAKQILAATEPQLKEQQRRVDNAKTQLKVWRKRLQEFPQEELKRLRREQARRAALRF